MSAQLDLITPPAQPALSLSQARAHLRVSHDDEDAMIADLIAAAAAMIEGPDGIGYALHPQTWRLTLDAFPARLRLPLRPVTGVSEVRYLDTEGDERVLDEEEYHVAISGGAALLVPEVNGQWPVTRPVPGAVRITFEAGAGVPPALRTAMLLMIGNWYDSREDMERAAQGQWPQSVAALVDPYRTGRVVA